MGLNNSLSTFQLHAYNWVWPWMSAIFLFSRFVRMPQKAILVSWIVLLLYCSNHRSFASLASASYTIDDCLWHCSADDHQPNWQLWCLNQCLHPYQCICAKDLHYVQSHATLTSPIGVKQKKENSWPATRCELFLFLGMLPQSLQHWVPDSLLLLQCRSFMRTGTVSNLLFYWKMGR